MGNVELANTLKIESGECKLGAPKLRGGAIGSGFFSIELRFAWLIH